MGFSCFHVCPCADSGSGLLISSIRLERVFSTASIQKYFHSQPLAALQRQGRRTREFREKKTLINNKKPSKFLCFSVKTPTFYVHLLKAGWISRMLVLFAFFLLFPWIFPVSWVATEGCRCDPSCFSTGASQGIPCFLQEKAESKYCST